jgi:hypothetical protein
MLKHILLASAVMVAAPALAQETPAQETTPPVEQTTPAQAAAPTAETPATAEPAAPAQEQAADATAAPAQPAQQPAQTAEAQPAQPAKQPATPAQIAAIVDQEFPTYDKDADGNLKSEEFGAWMVALRGATEPAFTGESAADKDWIGKALATADKDKSGSVNKDELKGFLAPQPS